MPLPRPVASPVLPLDRLRQALDVIDTGERHPGAGPVEVTALTHDSRRVVPGTLFCCLRGRHTDGHRHAPEAVAQGAVALLCERRLGLGVPELLVADARTSMGRAAAAFWGHPSRRLQVAGVTGTNGKTTTTWLLRAVLEAAGRPTGVIGTLGGPRTTPESTDLQAALAAMAGDGCSAVAMEVSSHALALSRVVGTEFSVAVFTNLGRDHLDFHGSMEEYFAAKARLFEAQRTAAAVVNTDDVYGRRLLEQARVPTRSFSLAEVTDVKLRLDGSTGTWRGRRLHVPFPGLANLSNALAAGAAALELGLDVDAVVEGLAQAAPVPGRFEPIHQGQPFAVVVDYAHNPEALDQLLTAARQGAGGGRVLVVFGCGGERDRDKRPLMGEVAAERADVVVVTSDNPRSEDPGAIIADVVGGAAGPGQVDTEPDRRAAIRRVLAGARPGDVVLVAGKGHEATQVLGHRTTDFDDRKVIRQELAALGFAGSAAS